MAEEPKRKRRGVRAVLKDLMPSTPRGTVPWKDLSGVPCPRCQGALDREGFCRSCHP